MALTDVAVRKAKYGLAKNKLADGHGLFLFLHSNGSRYWHYYYRFEGKQKTLALGVYPDVTLVKARQRHKEARYLVADGI